MVPAPRASGKRDITELTAARNSVRSMIGQLAAGFAFVFTFVGTIYNTDRTLNQKVSQDTAELFFRAMSKLETNQLGKEPQNNASAFFVLAKLAQSNPDYHDQIFSAVADYIRSEGGRKCSNKKDYWTIGYEMSSSLKAATQVLGYRDFGNDVSNRKLNLEDACLARIGLLEAWGTSRLFMPGANLVGGDLRNTRIFNSHMDGIDAGLDRRSDWPPPHHPDWIHIDAKQVIDAPDRFPLVATFEGAHIKDTTMNNIGLKGANLEFVRFERVALKEADLVASNLYGAVFIDTDVAKTNFRNANVAYADFRLAKNLTKEQLQTMCIWDPHVEKFDYRHSYKYEPRVPLHLRLSLGDYQFPVCWGVLPTSPM